MSTPEVTSEALFRASVGSPKAAYYVPKFLRFENGDSTRVSWNFAAFFFGCFWFVYRRMYVTAFLVLVGPLVLLYVPSLVLAGSLVASGSWVRAIPAIVYWFAVIPAYANFLYFNSVEQRIERLRRKAGDDGEVLEKLEKSRSVNVLAVWVAIVLVVCANTGFPYVSHYLEVGSEISRVARPQLEQAYARTDRMRSAVVKHYVSNHSWPDSMQTLVEEGQLERADLLMNARVDLGTITIRFDGGASPLLAGHNLSFRPSLAKTGAILWTCGYASPKGADAPGAPAGPDLTTVEPRVLPWQCTR